jgi:hypothetical protein
VQTGQFARARTDADDHLFRAKGQVVPPSQQSLPPLDGLECPCPLPKMIPNPVSARRSDGFTSGVLIDCEEDLGPSGRAYPHAAGRRRWRDRFP